MIERRSIDDIAFFAHAYPSSQPNSKPSGPERKLKRIAKMFVVDLEEIQGQSMSMKNYRPTMLE